jgi:hypothetical protein
MQVIRRNRLGNDTEDITYIPGGPGAIAVMEGYDVLSIPVPTTPGIKPPPPILETTPTQSIAGTAIAGTAIAGATITRAAARPGPIAPPSPATKLFNVLGLKIQAAPRGITFDPINRGFVFSDTIQPGTLFFCDALGRPTQNLNIRYPNGQPLFVEGLATIPANAPEFPNTFVEVALFEDEPATRLEIIDSRGLVVREIIPQGEPGTLFLTGISFRSPGSLLVSSDDDETIFELDFNGKILSTVARTRPAATRVLHGIEGVEVVNAWQTFAAGGFDGLLAFIDARTGLNSEQVVDYRIGPGLSLPAGLAWDSTNNRFLMLALDRTQDLNSAIVGLSPRLSGFQSLTQVDALTRRITYLPDENLIAATHSNNPRGILFFDKQGQPAGQISTQALGNPLIIGYIPTTQEFAVVFSAQQTRISILTRAGALSRTIDLAPAGVGRIGTLTFFNPSHPSGGQFLLTDRNTNTGIVIDFQGTILSKFEIRDTLQILSPTAVTAITTGPDTGAFAFANGETSEVVVFRLD